MLTSRLPAKDVTRTALVGLRFAVGAGALLTPRVTGRVLGIDAEANPASPYLSRLFGVRDLWLGSEVLMADDPDELARRHVYIDASDTLAAVLGGITGGLPKRAAALAAGAAAAATLLGLRSWLD